MDQFTCTAKIILTNSSTNSTNLSVPRCVGVKCLGMRPSVHLSVPYMYMYMYTYLSLWCFSPAIPSTLTLRDEYEQPTLVYRRVMDKTSHSQVQATVITLVCTTCNSVAAHDATEFPEFYIRLSYM